MTLGIEVRNLAEISDYLNKLPDKTFDEAKKVFQEAVLDADKEVKLRFSSKIIHSRTGTLRRSLRTSLTGSSLRNLRASFFSSANVAGVPVKYAPLQEFGGVIKAINKYSGVPGGPYLNIPTKSNLTPAGVMKKSAKELFNAGAHIHKSKAGNWGVFIGDKMMMVLKKKVVVPARLGMIDAADDQIPTILSKLIVLIGED